MLIASEGFVVRSGSALDDGGNGHPGNCGSYPGHNEAHPGFARLKVRVLVLDGRRPGIPSGEGSRSGMNIASWFILGMWIQGVEYAGGGR